MGYRAVVAGIAVSAVAGACGSTSRPPPLPEEKSGQGLPAETNDAAAAPSSFAPTAPPCSDRAKLVYVVDTAGVLHSFDPSLIPSMSAFQTIGTMNCTRPGGAPWALAGSMAIDRSGTAWVTDRVGQLFEVSTVDASCQSTAYRTGQQDYTLVGMGFSGEVSTGIETLYVVDNSQGPTSSGMGLARIDLASLALTRVGDFDGSLAGRGAELTGTGDGRLFGFFPGTQSFVAEIDPTSAHIRSSVEVPVQFPASLSGEYDWAFSFWGGVFYLYTADTSVAPFTDVQRYDPSTGTTTVVMSQIGFDITGAGSSTCAPTSTSK